MPGTGSWQFGLCLLKHAHPTADTSAKVLWLPSSAPPSVNLSFVSPGVPNFTFLTRATVAYFPELVTSSQAANLTGAIVSS
jgi:hypothetical protein